MRLCERTCSPEPSLITSVVSTSRVWGSAQVDFVLGSELCSRKEHTYRMIEVPVAWADYETILPNWEILGRGG